MYTVKAAQTVETVLPPKKLLYLCDAAVDGRAGAAVELVVGVYDPSDAGAQPSGKFVADVAKLAGIGVVVKQGWLIKKGGGANAAKGLHFDDKQWTIGGRKNWKKRWFLLETVPLDVKKMR